MKNNILNFCLILFLGIIFFNSSYAEQQFKFDITEIEISDDGNLIIGSNNGKAETYDGREITAENFVYNKSKNILNVSGKVKFLDRNINLEIFSDKATYQKNDEIIFASGNSKAVSQYNIITSSNFNFDISKNILIATNEVKYLNLNDGYTILTSKATYQKNDEIIFTEGNSKAISKKNTITASNFRFDRVNNILNADENVEFIDDNKNTKIFSDTATYQKNDEIIFTEGNSKAIIENKFKFLSKKVKYDKNNKELSSKEKSKVVDENQNQYNASEFIYYLENKLLKAKDVNLLSRIDESNTDNYFFSEGFFNFDKKSFVSKDARIQVHKNIFGNEEQDPRLYGTSSYGNDEITIINKGIFTSCKKNDNCPPWSIQSEKITHDKVKRDLIYKNAILKIYDVPVLYFPKFFHPDPTVDRRTGFLQPQFNRSKILGSSIYLPYFKTLGFDKDYTFKPTIFDDKIILQNEFRKKTKTSNLIADFSLTKGYQSSTDNKKKDINHLFAEYKKDLNLPNFLNSDLDLKIERVNNDTYLKVFQNNLFSSPVMPKDKNLMTTKLHYNFERNDSNLSAGFEMYEKLGVIHSDRYQYILPKYDFAKNIDFRNIEGSFNFYSSGSNNLKNTNNLRSSITNNLEYNSKNYFTESGFKNKFNLYFKNLNSVGKNDPTYKSTPRLEGMGIFEVSSELPMIKEDNFKKEILTPKISLRVNPDDNMKNYSSSNKIISTDNIFEINRLGISDSLETGKSLTLGIDYKLDFQNKETLNDKFLEFKLATVFRDKFESEIPLSSTLDKKNSNLFGSIESNLLKNLNFGYDFSINNNLNTFDSHSINTELSINNFITEFNFIEQRNNIGSNHILSNKTTYQFDENNSFSFSTRRNKEVSLTEYYDFSYQYKNDCLTAGIKYNKTFYQDNDLKPSENLFFTISLIPLTTYERTIYDN